MSAEKEPHPQPASGEEAPAAPQPVSEKFRELAELEQEIRRRLRSNQRFLEKFLDEDFVDDEPDGDDEAADDEKEEL
jgi:hypothetical protein